MCRTFNMVGSFVKLKSHLEKNKIHDFNSLNEIIDFHSSYTTYRQRLISDHESLIEQEKNMLKLNLHQLDTEIETQRQSSEQRLIDQINKLQQKLKILSNAEPISFFQKLKRDFNQWHCSRLLKNKKHNFDKKVKKSISKLINIHKIKNNRYQFITSQFSEAVRQSSQKSLSELERKKAVLDELSSFIYGALGEQKVVERLETLSDEYFLINDFLVSFSPAIYHRQENDYIQSVQIDHLLVAPSGIFLIETKNWSEKSLENLSLRSPVQQIKRTSFAMFQLLNNEKISNHINLDKHHWGNKKIAIKNLIVLVNTKPKEEFQFVKILTLNELIGYINYFKPIFSSVETKIIAEFMLRINAQKTIDTR